MWFNPDTCQEEGEDMDIDVLSNFKLKAKSTYFGTTKITQPQCNPSIQSSPLELSMAWSVMMLVISMFFGSLFDS